VLYRERAEGREGVPPRSIVFRQQDGSAAGE